MDAAARWLHAPKRRVKPEPEPNPPGRWIVYGRDVELVLEPLGQPEENPPPRVAALYVEPRGPYADRPDVDPWSLERDAKNYRGPWPVVAHPPCGPWGRLRRFSTKQDPTLGPLAVRQVQQYGGVLEHPSSSKLWEFMDLPLPGELPGVRQTPGFTVQVDQVNWGHPARKRTWVYIVGVKPEEVDVAPPFPNRKPERVIGSSTRGRRETAERLTYASKRTALLSPPAFSDWLIDIASRAKPGKHRGTPPADADVARWLEENPPPEVELVRLPSSVGLAGNGQKSTLVYDEGAWTNTPFAFPLENLGLMTAGWHQQRRRQGEARPWPGKDPEKRRVTEILYTATSTGRRRRHAVEGRVYYNARTGLLSGLGAWED